MATKQNEITRIAVIATTCPSGAGVVHVAPLPKSWNKKRIFCILKEEYDKMKRQEEKANARRIETFANALVSRGGKTHGR